MSLRESLAELAEQAPTTPMPAGLFDRARRRQRRRWTAAVAALGVLALAGVAVSLPGLPTGRFGAGPAGIPGTLSAPRAWTAEVRAAPAGPASVVFRGPAVPARQPFADLATGMGVVGLTSDTYRVVYAGQSTLALSPDGRTLLVPHLTGQTWRTDALDLSTGRSRLLATGFTPVDWSSDGTHAVLVHWDRWAPPDPLMRNENDMTVRVVAWPSGRSGWSVHIGRPDAVEGETNYPVSLSPDGSMLAVSTSHELRVYGSDGVLRWTRPLAGLDVLGGPAAWRTDGRLAVMHRSPVSSWAVPGDWTVTYVDGRTGEPRPGPGLPTVRSVFALRIVAWRGGTAYAIARTSTGRPGSEIHASLVRLAPGGSGPEPLLSPDRVEDLGIATDYADATRPAGSPSYGFSLLGTVSLAYGYAWPATMVVGGAVLVWWLRRRRLERGRMRPAPVTGPSGSGTGTAR